MLEYKQTIVHRETSKTHTLTLTHTAQFDLALGPLTNFNIRVAVFLDKLIERHGGRRTYRQNKEPNGVLECAVVVCPTCGSPAPPAPPHGAAAVESV